jgi:hypothetical protein
MVLRAPRRGGKCAPPVLPGEAKESQVAIHCAEARLHAQHRMPAAEGAATQSVDASSPSSARRPLSRRATVEASQMVSGASSSPWRFVPTRAVELPAHARIATNSTIRERRGRTRHTFQSREKLVTRLTLQREARCKLRRFRVRCGVPAAVRGQWSDARHLTRSKLAAQGRASCRTSPPSTRILAGEPQNEQRTSDLVLHRFMLLPRADR